MVTVIIPTINDPYLEKTIENVRQSAGGEVEFIVINDGGNPLSISGVNILNNPEMRGRRFSINQAARIARGEYLFILDSHCSMTQDWDLKMIQSVRGRNLVYCVIRDMDAQTWQYKPGDYLHVTLNEKYTEKWWNRKKLKDCDVEEESIALTGCAWMVSTARYWELGGYDESLGFYGWDGPEWALKVWMNNGKVILRTDVICGHIFGTNDRGRLYPCKMIPEHEYVKYMEEKYSSRMDELFNKFPDAPNWRVQKMDSQKTIIEHTVTQTRVKETTDDATGKVIRKWEEVWEFTYTGKKLSNEDAIKKYGKNFKKVGEKELKVA